MSKKKPEQTPALSGWVIKNEKGAYIGRDGIWTADPLKALRFDSEKDAAGYNDLHCAGAFVLAQGV